MLNDLKFKPQVSSIMGKKIINLPIYLAYVLSAQ